VLRVQYAAIGSRNEVWRVEIRVKVHGWHSTVSCYELNDHSSVPSRNKEDPLWSLPVISAWRHQCPVLDSNLSELRHAQVTFCLMLAVWLKLEDFVLCDMTSVVLVRTDLSEEHVHLQSEKPPSFFGSQRGCTSRLAGKRAYCSGIFVIVSVCYHVTASVLQWSDFLTADSEVPGSIPGAVRFSE
jgi:hypothetical protein